MIYIQLLFVPVLLASSTLAFGVEAFRLENTHPRRATFSFYSDNSEQWEDQVKTISKGGKANFTLTGGDKYQLHLYVENSQYGEKTNSFYLNELIAGRDNPQIKLSEIMTTETRTQTYTIEKHIPETKTRMVPVTKYRSEQRTKTVIERDPETGKQYEKATTYTVRVPYTEQVEQSYTVVKSVPELVTRNVTVQIPVEKLTVGTGNNRVEVLLRREKIDSRDTKLPQDKRQRYLGITVSDTSEGPLVIQVEANSPAKRLKLVGSKDTRNYIPTLNHAVIVEVNGIQVRNGLELRQEVQRSPPLVVLTIKTRGCDTAYRYRTQLEMRK